MSYNQPLPGTFVETAIPVGSVAEEYVVLDRLLGAGSYERLGQSLVERGGRWYDVIDVMLYDGTPARFFFDINSFFVLSKLSRAARALRPPGLPPVRTALAQNDLREGGINMGAALAFVLIGAVGGALLTKSKRRWP